MLEVIFTIIVSVLSLIIAISSLILVRNLFNKYKSDEQFEENISFVKESPGENGEKVFEVLPVPPPPPLPGSTPPPPPPPPGKSAAGSTVAISTTPKKVEGGSNTRGNLLQAIQAGTPLKKVPRYNGSPAISTTPKSNTRGNLLQAIQAGTPLKKVPRYNGSPAISTTPKSNTRGNLLQAIQAATPLKKVPRYNGSPAKSKEFDPAVILKVNLSSTPSKKKVDSGKELTELELAFAAREAKGVK